MNIRIINADVMDGLAQLDDESVHCVVTSPPYWGLRDYGAEGQIGLEPTLAEHIDRLVQVFREVRRVLRKDGTLWLNYGDGYANNASTSKLARSEQGNGSGAFQIPPEKHHQVRRAKPNRLTQMKQDGFKHKDLLMMPERLALALQADGWWVRARIIWHKPNPMPESVTDRPTKSHEHIWLLTKSPRYFYDAEAIKESAVSDHPSGNGFKREARLSYLNADGTPRGSDRQWNDVGGSRNARDVWTIATAPFSEAHFATFPPELAERCIKAGTSEKGCCAECGAPWVRVTERVDSGFDGSKYGARAVAASGGAISGGTAKSTLGSPNGKLTGKHQTTGWRPSCTCNADVVSCTVLDPFGGSGTTGLVADRLQRNAILIELNPQYAEMARRRLERDSGLFASVEIETAEAAE